jgi:hypothetical protein
MLLTGTAVVAGVGIGWLLPHPGNRFSRARLEFLAVLVGGLLLSRLAGHIDGGAGLAVQLASYAALIGFALLNMQLPGTGVLAIGLGLNALVIALNGGMPVRASALVDARLAVSEDRTQFVELRGERHIEEPDDRITFLGDIIPIRPIRQVVSFGDLVLGIGIVTLIVGVLRPPPKRKWRPQ